MSPTLQTGDKIVVSKLQYGARLPRSGFEIPWLNLFWFLNTKTRADMGKDEWGYRRLNGYSQINRGDVVVFNYQGKMFEFYIKRCVALPGDTLKIIKGQLFINEKKSSLPENTKHYYRIYYSNFSRACNLLDSLQINYHNYFFGRKKSKFLIANITKSQIRVLKKYVYLDSMAFHIDTTENQVEVFPFIDSLQWSKDNYGPLYIPAKGQSIDLNPKNYAIYANIIEKFENTEIQNPDSGFYINSKRVTSYRFKQNYYFMMGDNRSLSMDSQYWGFVPESDIVGKAVMVLFSYNEGFKWDRIFKLIN